MKSHTQQSVLQPEYSTEEAAPIVGAKPSTLKKSRVTGKLFGRPAPKFQKKGKKVTYTAPSLKEFNDQFELHANTAEYGGCLVVAPPALAGSAS